MKNLLVIASLLLLVSSAAVAQDDDLFVKDVLEVNFYGGAGDDGFIFAFDAIKFGTGTIG